MCLQTHLFNFLLGGQIKIQCNAQESSDVFLVCLSCSNKGSDSREGARLANKANAIFYGATFWVKIPHVSIHLISDCIFRPSL